jgi:hypothetical protein
MLSVPVSRKRLMAVLRGVVMTWGAFGGADLGAVFVVGDVADPVVPVLDAPVAWDPGHRGRWWCVVVVGGGDQVDDLEGPFPVRREGAS